MTASRPSTADSPTVALGALSPRTRWETFASRALVEEQLAEISHRAPPFLILFSTFMALRGLGDWFYMMRDMSLAARLHVAVACVLALGAMLAMWIRLRRARVPLQAKRVAPHLFVVALTVVYWLLARCVAVGGTVGHMGAVMSLVFVLFVRTFIAPMTWKQSVATGVILWLTHPAAWIVGRLVSGAWSLPAEHPDLVYTVTCAVFVLSVSVSAIGSHVILGLRRRTYEASEATRYHLKGMLGAGGMSDVYLAHHGTLKAACAVKVCRIPPGSDAESIVSRFELEAQQVARLAHPNIVKVFDYGQLDDGSLYFAMEYLRGIDLMAYLRRYGSVAEERLVYWMEQVLRAMDHAHAQGLLHLDLKPANLFLTDNGAEPDFVKVLDFGVARLLSQPDRRRPGDIAGTPAYMAPEQAQFTSDLDPRADLYALGAVMYQLATGQYLFEAESLPQLIALHASQPPPALREIAPTCSLEIEAVIARLLEKSPSDRFPSANDTREALRRTPYWGLWTRERAAAWWSQYEMEALPGDLASSATLSSESITLEVGKRRNPVS